MKILLVHNFYRIPGGEDTVVRNEEALLKNHGHEVILYTRNNSEYSNLKGLSKLKKLSLLFVTLYNPKTARDIKRIIRDEKIDVVHVHNTLNLISPSVYYSAVSCGVPVFQTIHNYRLLCPAATFSRDVKTCEDCVSKGLSCALKHKCYRGSFLETLACVMLLKIHRRKGIYRKINYICLTEFSREKLLLLNCLGEKRQNSGGCEEIIDAKKVFVKPNFMAEEISEASSEENTKGFSQIETARDPYFIFAGRLDALKGIDFLVNSWSPDMPKLVVCGTGPLEEALKRDICKENVEFRGFTEREELMKLMAGAAALILPTRWYEGFPMSMVEAFSVGTPVIASNIGNAGILVEEGINGYKFEVDDEKSLKDAVKKILESMVLGSSLCASTGESNALRVSNGESNALRVSTGESNALRVSTGESNTIRTSTREMYREKYTPEKNYEILMSIYSAGIEDMHRK